MEDSDNSIDEESEHDSNYGELHLSFESSPFGSENGDENLPLGALPYQFEPEADRSSEIDDEEHHAQAPSPEITRVGNTDWYVYGNKKSNIFDSLIS